MSEKTINISELIPDDHNFNKGTQDGAEIMDKSFREHGAGRSILIDKDDRIIAGNKSQKAAIAAGITRVRIIETTGDELIAVKRTDITLDSKEGREMALVDNLSTQVNLAWDPEEVTEMQNEFGLDVDEWGGAELVFGEAHPGDEKPVDEDDFSEERDNVPAVVKPGEIWQLGEHRLMCGDSTSGADVQALMMGEKADLWLTDPPYNVAVENSQGMTIANDNMSSENFGKFLSAAFSAAFAVLADGCPFYVWFASKEHINFEGALNSVGLRVRQELIWNKNHFILGRAHYQWKHEPCLYGWKGGSCKYFVDARNRASVIPDAGEIDIEKMKAGEMRELLRKIYGAGLPTTVIDCDKPMKDADHPTMKPVKLFGFQMQNSTIGGGIVLDTFGGSGTTIVAAEQLGRRARLMELDPHYCDVIIARWEKLTGKKATKIQ